jgi:hypothetical protein
VKLLPTRMLRPSPAGEAARLFCEVI